jgi:Holliday junction DNA helicase RuvA
MISFLLGRIIEKDDKRIILEKQGMGFEVFLSAINLDNIRIGEERNIYTFLFVSDKNIELYGFLSVEELGLFKLLNHISGIGPKTAMILSSVGSLEKLKESLEKGEIPADIKGVGKKKLQKILLEISGKIKEIKKPKEIKKDEVYKALSVLGFEKEEIFLALSKIPEEIKNDEDRIKCALKFLGK